MTGKTELIRIAARTLAQGGNPISNLQICEALGAKTENGKSKNTHSPYRYGQNWRTYTDTDRSV